MSTSTVHAIEYNNDSNPDEFFMDYETAHTVGMALAVTAGCVFLLIAFYYGTLVLCFYGHKRRGSDPAVSENYMERAGQFFVPLRVSVCCLLPCLGAAGVFLSIYGQQQISNEEMYSHSGPAYITDVYITVTDSQTVKAFVELEHDICSKLDSASQNSSTETCKFTAPIPTCDYTDKCYTFHRHGKNERDCDEDDFKDRTKTVRYCYRDFLGWLDDLPDNGGVNANYELYNSDYVVLSNKPVKAYAQCPCSEGQEASIADPFQQAWYTKIAMYICLGLGVFFLLCWPLFCGCCCHDESACRWTSISFKEDRANRAAEEQMKKDAREEWYAAQERGDFDRFTDAQLREAAEYLGVTLDWERRQQLSNPSGAQLEQKQFEQEELPPLPPPILSDWEQRGGQKEEYREHDKA